MRSSSLWKDDATALSVCNEGSSVVTILLTGSWFFLWVKKQLLTQLAVAGENKNRVSGMMFTHLKNALPSLVGVGAKKVTERRAIARCVVELPRKVWDALREDNNPKGPVLATATVAGVSGAKKTSDLIPLCHQVPLDDCQVRFDLQDPLLHVECEAVAHAKTGVEMEALSGCSHAALCVYDMCKGIDNDIVITDLRLVMKTGGKSDVVRK